LSTPRDGSQTLASGDREIMSQQYWESRWQEHSTGWDLRQVSPPIAAYIDQLPATAHNDSILIPGCGNGYEALYLLQHGFTNITMLDIAPTAVETLRHRLDAEAPGWEDRLHLVCGDFFAHTGAYDLILEQTFFCAIDPSLRPDYARQMKALLKPGGKVAGVLFNREFEGGPPFSGSLQEYQYLFSPLFSIQTAEPCYNSIPPRAGTELFVILVNA
jgi:SAM-dependent methyltransferase